MPKRSQHAQQMRASEVRQAIREGQSPADVPAGRTYSDKRPPQWFRVTSNYTDLATGKRYHAGDIVTQRTGRNIAAQDEGRGWRNLSQKERAYARYRRPDARIRKARNAFLEMTVEGTGRSDEAVLNDPAWREAFIEYYIRDQRQAASTTANKRSYAAFLAAIGVIPGDPEDYWEMEDPEIAEWWHEYQEA